MINIVFDGVLQLFYEIYFNIYLTVGTPKCFCSKCLKIDWRQNVDLYFKLNYITS